MAKLSIRPWKGFGQRFLPDGRTWAGFGLLLVTAFGWGLNWSATKFLIATCPPLTARGTAGIAACAGLAAVAAARGEVLSVPLGRRARLVRAAALNVTAWMGLTTVSMLWLRAGEAATLAYTMPIWAALVAWPVLNEPLTRGKILALTLGIGGICVLFAGTEFGVGDRQLPGVIIALSAAMLFAAGTVLSKRWPLEMPPLPRPPGRWDLAASRCSPRVSSLSSRICCTCHGSAGWRLATPPQCRLGSAILYQAP
jgi:drug/metabolite transporter (DMT)-like permease